MTGGVVQVAGACSSGGGVCSSVGVVFVSRRERRCLLVEFMRE